MPGPGGNSSTTAALQALMRVIREDELDTVRGHRAWLRAERALSRSQDRRRGQQTARTNARRALRMAQKTIDELRAENEWLRASGM